MRSDPCERCGGCLRLEYERGESHCANCGAVRYGEDSEMSSLRDEWRQAVPPLSSGVKQYHLERRARNRARREEAVGLLERGETEDAVASLFGVKRGTLLAWRNERARERRDSILASAPN